MSVGDGSILPPRSDIGAPDALATALANPHREAERAFVGCLLWLPEGEARAAASSVQPEDLADPETRAVLVAVHDLLAQGRRPEPAHVVPQLMLNGWPADRFGAAAVLVADLLGCPLVPTAWPCYRRTVMAGSVSRRVDEAAHRLHQLAGSTDDLLVVAKVVGAEVDAVTDLIGRAAQVIAP